MITKQNLKSMLTEALHFTKATVGEFYTRHFDSVNCEVSVDFDNEKIIYPIDKGFKVNEQQTVNFSDNENFVVLECVCRLLEKGYRPEHLELERRWKLGHDQKGGRADICVANEEGTETLFIVECKTAGAEFNKELKNIKNDGGQLFSYWQQSPSAQWLVLYASDFADGILTYKSPTIRCIDDANLLKQAEKDKDMLTFERAKKNADVEGKFQVWVETYNRQMHEDVIFNDNTVAYQIGVRPLRKQDLRDFEPEDRIVNRFEEILRHNNVSDKENAFNRLVALFICKLVDEIKKEDYEEVDFQYKQGTDTYEDLQDRLQRLHKQGMEYVSDFDKEMKRLKGE